MTKATLSFILILFINLPTFSEQLDSIQPSMWADPSREPTTFEEWINVYPYNENFESEIIEKLQGAEEHNRRSVAIITEGSIYPDLQGEIDELALRLWLEGYTVLNCTYTGGTPELFKNFLRTLYYNEGIKGALLIEMLPAAFYQAWTFPGYDYRYEEWPCDLFYMDLDGNWEDNFVFPRPNYQPEPGQDGIFDTHYGSVEPEIFIGRLITRCDNQVEKIELLKNYFSKDFSYRDAVNPLPQQAMLYIDDPWHTEAIDWAQDVAMLYPNTVIFNEPDETRASDYRIKLRTPQAHVLVAAHSTPSNHRFYYWVNYSDIYWSNEYMEESPPTYFYNFYACSFCRFTDLSEPTLYGGGYSIFNDYGVGAIGPTKTGGMRYLDQYYYPLSQGKTTGAAFFDWFYYIAIEGNGYSNSDRDWFYGMTSLGDPFLKPKGNIPCLLSSYDRMTAFNNTPRIVRSRSGRLHMVYTGGTPEFPKIYYAYSDDGLSWYRQFMGDGEYPTIALYKDGSNDVPCIVWCTKSRENMPPYTDWFDYNVYHYTYIGANQSWIVGDAKHYWWQYPPPGIKVSPPSICLQNDNVFISYECGPWPGVAPIGNNVAIRSFPVYIPSYELPMIIYQAQHIDTLTSIISDQDGNIVIAFSEPSYPTNILGIAYKVNNQWNIQPVENSVIDPSLTVNYNTLVLTYRYENDIYCRYGTRLGNSYSWGQHQNVSQNYTPNPSLPFAITGNDLVWTSNGEIFYSYHDGSKWKIPMKISNYPVFSNYPQACIETKNINRWLHAVWTEGDNGPLFWIRSAKVKLPIWCVSADNATGPNNGELLTVDDANGNIHMVYNTGSTIAYTKSTDKGETWNDVVEVDSGSYPSVALDSSGLPRISYLKNDTVFCQILKPDSSWDTVVIFGYNESWEPEQPAVAPSYPPELANYSYSTFSTVDPFSANSKINLSIFDVTEDIAPPADEVASGDSLKSPSIAITPGDYIHVVWGQKGEIYYRTSLQPIDTVEEIVWSDIYNVSASPMVYSENPVVEAYGENIIVAWKEGNPGEVYRRIRNINSDVSDWSTVENISQSPAQESDYPVLSTQDVVAWQEQLDSSNYEIYAWIQGDIVNLSETEGSSKYPHIAVEPQEYNPDTLNPTIVVNAIWTEEIIGDSLYEIRFKRYEHNPTDSKGTGSIEYISVSVGDSLASPYCKKRDGYIKYGEYSLDYSLSSLVYNLPYLKPQSSYLVKALVYQGERGRWRERMYIDTTLAADVYIDPNIPRLVNILLPKASYGTDLEINKEIRRILGRVAIVADLKVYEVNLPDTFGGKDNIMANREGLMHYALYQNRPNPFKGMTKISFALPRECNVSLFIYDITGRRVRTLISGKMQPGNYNYTWDGKDNRNRRLTQGVYFYRLQTEDFKDTKKTILLK